jgi:hypothetical protein
VVKILSFKRRAAVAAALVLLALFLFRPGASRLKSRIIYSISAAVGRPVDIDSVHIRLLPPGFDLNNLVVYDDPAFGAEPMLRASEVTAALRLTSLLRGHLEIARLNLTEPSLNLARRDGGRWNFQSVLEKTARIPLAPTGKVRSEPRFAFPYIEATSGRINFKTGAEKRPYALTNADFSLWQESDNSWGMRLQAQPFRSDMNLNDMGLLQVSGTWQRSQEIRDTPLQFSLEWGHAQLGQLTKFMSGTDRGWRGEILLDVTLKGTPANLHISANSSVDDFRRYDITSGKALRMTAYCDADYSSSSYEFHQVMCHAPVGDGLIRLTGEMGLPGSKRYAVALTAEQVPANALVLLAQRMKKNLPDDLAAEGAITAHLSIDNDGQQSRFAGKGDISDFHLTSEAIKGELGPVNVPFAMAGGSGAIKTPTKVTVAANTPSGAYIELAPFGLGAPRIGAATIRARIDRAGYSLSLAGDAEVAKTLRLARMAGISALNSTADGTAQLDLHIAGQWARSNSGAGGDFSGPQVTGSAKLRNISIAPHNFGGPVEIGSAEMQLAPELVRVTKLSAKAAGATWTGSLDLPRGCGTPEACTVHFALKTAHMAIGDVTEWAHSAAKKRAWYKLLEPHAEARPTLLANLHAVGQLSVDRLQIFGVQATQVSSNVSVSAGKIQFSSIGAEVLGGKHRGEWSVDFGSKSPLCKGSGNLTDVSLDAVAAAMDDGWISGTGDANYDLKGPCGAKFWPSATGTVRASLTDGAFPHILLADNPEPLRVLRMNGKAQLGDEKFEIADTQINSPDGVYELSGSASLDRDLDLKLNRVRNNVVSQAYAISGSITEPRVTAIAAGEQARLKSLPTK